MIEAMTPLMPFYQTELPSAEELRALGAAVERCRDEQRYVSIPVAMGNAYAYPHSADGIAWGINGGSNGFLIYQGRTPRCVSKPGFASDLSLTFCFSFHVSVSLFLNGDTEINNISCTPLLNIDVAERRFRHSSAH